jgi:virulence-associated protein VapD
MFAIAFDMVVADLKTHYGEPYNRAYYEIKVLLEHYGFEWAQGSTYISQSDDLGIVFKTIMALSKIEWFKKSVRDIRAFRVENWSDFTEIVKSS